MLKVIVDEVLLWKLAKEEMRKHLERIYKSGTWWGLKHLEPETCCKRDWFIGNILLNPKFKKEMKIIFNGRENGRWMFRATTMKEFLDGHFQELNGKQRVGLLKSIQI